jgi:hypothetical protein
LIDIERVFSAGPSDAALARRTAAPASILAMRVYANDANGARAAVTGRMMSVLWTMTVPDGSTLGASDHRASARSAHHQTPFPASRSAVELRVRSSQFTGLRGGARLLKANGRLERIFSAADAGVAPADLCADTVMRPGNASARTVRRTHSEGSSGGSDRNKPA